MTWSIEKDVFRIRCVYLFLLDLFDQDHPHDSVGSIVSTSHVIEVKNMQRFRGGGSEYSYIRVKPDECLFRSDSSSSI